MLKRNLLLVCAYIYLCCCSLVFSDSIKKLFDTQQLVRKHWLKGGVYKRFSLNQNKNTNCVIRVVLWQSRRDSYYCEIMSTNNNYIVSSKVVSPKKLVRFSQTSHGKQSECNLLFEKFFDMPDIPPKGLPIGVDGYELLLEGTYRNKTRVYQYDFPGVNTKDRGIESLVEFAYKCFDKGAFHTNDFFTVKQLLNQSEAKTRLKRGQAKTAKTR